jgi:diguanylate cyclase (GGDEF)-like protein
VRSVLNTSRGRVSIPLLGLFLVITALVGIRLIAVGSFLHSRTTIAEIRDASGPVQFQGVVTYADAARKRFWIQDETGALQLPCSKTLEPGQLVRVKARAVPKTQGSANEVLDASLTDVRVIVTGERRALPVAVTATLQASVQRDFGGLRIQLAGVLHAKTRDSSGSEVITFGDGSSEASAVLPGGSQLPPLNTSVEVSGVAEGIPGENGFLKAQRLWAAAPGDLHIVAQPPSGTPVQTIRSLFADPAVRDGHRIRLRAHVIRQNTPISADIGDDWGAITAELERPLSIPAGRELEITGFPRFFGFQLQIQHATVIDADRELYPGADYQSNALRSVAAVRHLTTPEASGATPVIIDGVVTFADSSWKALFVQDSTGGIYVSYSTKGMSPKPGDRVTVTGVSNLGDYAPVIVAANVIRKGRVSLPRPVPITPRDAVAGVLDSVFVEAEGVVHALASKQDPTHLAFSLYSSFGTIRVITSPSFGTQEQLEKIEDATARIRGICGTIFNSRRQLVGYQLLVSNISDITVIGASGDPFAARATPINQLLQYTPNGRLNHRVKVSGAVTMVGEGFFYLEDDSGGLRVEGNSNNVRAGALVEAAGYPTPGAYSPVLREAVVHILPSPGEINVKPMKLDWNATANSDSRLVTVEGRVLSVMNVAAKKTLALESGGRIFDAQLYLRHRDENVPVLAEGSIVRLTGISSSQADTVSSSLLDPYADPGVRILIRSAQDIQVLKRASWWNLRHTVVVVGTLLTVIVATLAWLNEMRRRMRKQQAELFRANEKTQAVRDLATAMQVVTQEKDYSARVQVSGEHDIALLGAEFNKMIAELYSRELEKLEAQKVLQRQALTDELTGLPNRRLFSDRLNQTLESAKREKRIVGLLYLDLDGFKLVNDSLGHRIGDVLLAEVAVRLKARIRTSDTLARLGGDEFAVLLTGIHSREDSDKVAEALLGQLSQKFEIEGHEIRISASIGISVYPENGKDANELLQQADSAMYAAKRSGKSRMLNFTSEMGLVVRERVTLENELRGALDRGEIQVHYQPEYEVNENKLIRFEALARWTHPTLGNIPPSKFVPVAEESGLIIPLGAYVLERACSDALQWQKHSPRPIQVAVNISSIEFMQDGFVDRVIDVLKRKGLAPELLQLELTETVMLHGTQRAAGAMKRLRAFGIGIAIDDFGTGYSCFGYLPQLPFNTLKIDRSFVRELHERPEAKALIQSLISLAHNLSMQVVVEGIETTEQLSAVKALGGNQVQGYLLGRPTAHPLSVIASFANGFAESDPEIARKTAAGLS